ncbi:hypothetical protein DQD18_15055 [Salmonella enterica subsp. enterica serovar Oranienburg]|nr:hypothetical protein [Salmonella enterica subsp. enterica serovar Oranienburg]EBV1655895.1 hypothetical protein [Salmonella enterica subsp. enterica serovar Oranienburg]EBW7315168.1 hypothetical protein [Salmonella enterica subsp. enterica serovar Oranienburg]ECF2300900.1 hypothetical protein [Salmonella enterica subsp. enterica serovar Oranienburg]
MQKINALFPLLLLASCYLQAAPQMSATPSSALPAAGVQPPVNAPDKTAPPATPGQDQIVRALQDDIVFEREKRQLSNELALEKLRAELLKVRGDSAPAVVMPSAPPPVAMPVEQSGGVTETPRAVPPSVVLVSQVAGVSRVAVSVSGQLRFISRNEVFSANGKKYRLVPSGNSHLMVREVK